MLRIGLCVYRRQVTAVQQSCLHARDQGTPDLIRYLPIAVLGLFGEFDLFAAFELFGRGAAEATLEYFIIISSLKITLDLAQLTMSAAPRPRIRLLLPSQRINMHALSTPSLFLSELSGSLGDLGTLLPLLIGLTLTNSINLRSTLVFTGLANILTGLIFRIPLPVQPMKAIAAVAIARRFTVDETVSAGLFVAGCVGLAAGTGVLGWAGRVVPVPVVKGIQVGAGLSLVISAGGPLLLGSLAWTGQSWWGESMLWAVGAFVLLLVTTATARTGSRPRFPYALLVFAVGLVFALTSIYGVSSSSAPYVFGFWRPRVLVPDRTAFLTGTLSAGLGQLPLTTLNSIIAVAHLSADLLPSSPIPSTTSLGFSVAAMNLAGAWFGAMPVCHGAGGLAAQHRFGARSGASVVMLGLGKLALGLAINEQWLVTCLRKFPPGLLGVMVLAAGVELARAGQSLNGAGARDLWEEVEGSGSDGKRVRELTETQKSDRWMVMMITVGGLLAFKNDAVGFTAGVLWHWALEVPKWWEMRRRRGRRLVQGEDSGLLNGLGR